MMINHANAQRLVPTDVMLMVHAHVRPIVKMNAIMMAHANAQVIAPSDAMIMENVSIAKMASMKINRANAQTLVSTVANPMVPVHAQKCV